MDLYMYVPPEPVQARNATGQTDTELDAADSNTMVGCNTTSGSAGNSERRADCPVVLINELDWLNSASEHLLIIWDQQSLCNITQLCPTQVKDPP